MGSRWCHHREVFRSDEGGARAALQRTALPAAIFAGKDRHTPLLHFDIVSQVVV